MPVGGTGQPWENKKTKCTRCRPGTLAEKGPAARESTQHCTNLGYLTLLIFMHHATTTNACNRSWRLCLFSEVIATVLACIHKLLRENNTSLLGGGNEAMLNVWCICDWFKDCVTMTKSLESDLNYWIVSGVHDSELPPHAKIRRDLVILIHLSGWKVYVYVYRINRTEASVVISTLLSGFRQSSLLDMRKHAPFCNKNNSSSHQYVLFVMR